MRLEDKMYCFLIYFSVIVLAFFPEPQKGIMIVLVVSVYGCILSVTLKRLLALDVRRCCDFEVNLLFISSQFLLLREPIEQRV